MRLTLLLAGLVVCLGVVGEAGGSGSSGGYVLYSVGQDGQARRTAAVLDSTLFYPPASGGGESGGLLGRSPNGTRLLVAGPRGVVLAHLDGSSPVTLTPPGEAVSLVEATAAFSPDGSRVAFSVATPACVAAGAAPICWNLYTARADGTQTTHLAAAESDPLWSADGTWFAYLKLGTSLATGDLYAVRKGGAPRLLAHSVYTLAFAPTGDRLAYTAEDPSGAGSHLWTVDVATGRRQELPTRGGTALLWSPDGRRIAYEAPGNYGSYVSVLTFATGKARAMTHQLLVGQDDTPLAWSPDGSRLAFQRTCAPGGFIPFPAHACLITVWAIGLQRRNTVRLTHDDRLWRDTRWTGKRLTYFAAP